MEVANRFEKHRQPADVLGYRFQREQIKIGVGQREGQTEQSDPVES